MDKMKTIKLKNPGLAKLLEKILIKPKNNENFNDKNF